MSQFDILFDMGIIYRFFFITTLPALTVVPVTQLGSLITVEEGMKKWNQYQMIRECFTSLMFFGEKFKVLIGRIFKLMP